MVIRGKQLRITHLSPSTPTSNSSQLSSLTSWTPAICASSHSSCTPEVIHTLSLTLELGLPKHCTGLLLTFLGLFSQFGSVEPLDNPLKDAFLPHPPRPQCSYPVSSTSLSNFYLIVFIHIK